jgi:hypothetical protein
MSFGVSKGRRISRMKKGKFSFNHHIFRDRISFSSIENLSNELFYEIFDYLDGWDLYQAFANLNNHFEQLVHSPFVRLKIKLCHWRTDDQFENNWKQMIDLHREQIFSMDLSIVPSTMDFFSFNHLQSLTLRYLEFNVCMSVLLKLRSLPCLVSFPRKNFLNKTAVNRGFNKSRKSDRLFGFRNRSKPRCRNTAVKTQATAVRVAKSLGCTAVFSVSTAIFLDRGFLCFHRDISRPRF